MEWPQQRYWDNWKNECALADHIVVNSEWSRQALQQEGIDTNKIATIPLAYQRASDVEMTSDPMPAEFSANRRLRVLFLGQVNLRKGVKELTQAIRLLHNDPVEWTVVGGGDERLMSELRELPLTTVTGPVSRAEARRHYQQADVFILPTHSDGFALTQLEAAACGLPVVASQFCGDVVRHHQNGLRLSEVSPSAIVDAIRKLAQSPRLVGAMRQRQQDTDLLSLSDLGSQFLSLHHRCVQNAA